MKVGGQILWNVTTPICETSQISYLMGRLPMKDVLGKQLKDRLFPLVHWLSIILLLRRTSQESINLERKSHLDWKGDVLVADLEELETMDASEICSKRLNAKEVIFHKKRRIYFSNRRWTNQNPWRKSGPENIHLGTASTNSRRE